MIYHCSFPEHGSEVAKESTEVSIEKMDTVTSEVTSETALAESGVIKSQLVSPTGQIFLCFVDFAYNINRVFFIT